MLHGIPLQSKNHTALQLHMENTDEMVLSPSAELPQPFHKAQMWMPDIPLSSLSDQVYGMPLKYAELQCIYIARILWYIKRYLHM